MKDLFKRPIVVKLSCIFIALLIVAYLRFDIEKMAERNESWPTTTAAFWISIFLLCIGILDIVVRLFSPKGRRGLFRKT